MEVAHAEILAEMLYTSAVAFEGIRESADFQIRDDCVDLRVPVVKMLCEDIGAWYQLLNCVYYDATFGLQELLDFLVVFLDGW